MTFEATIRQARACTLCAAYLPLGPRPVFQIDPEARILVAGQAPGARVHETGIPFNDASGDRLRDWMGIGRDVFYDPLRIAILPMGYCYPGTGPSGDLPPRPECAATWRRRMLAFLPDVQLTLVIGQYAQNWHLGAERQATLTDTVRQWQIYWPSQLPLPHPSPRNNMWLKRNPWFEEAVLPVLRKRVAEVLG